MHLDEIYLFLDYRILIRSIFQCLKTKIFQKIKIINQDNQMLKDPEFFVVTLVQWATSLQINKNDIYEMIGFLLKSY